jgi:(S)-3,5-dihydroxyphenylglycine transaminase
MTPPPVSLRDYERLARECVDHTVWDFVAGGSGDERSLAANSAAFDRVSLLPRVLTGASEPDLSATVLGRTWAAPIGVAPMAYHTMLHPDGEVGTAHAAGQAGLPLVVSTFAGRTLEDVAAAATAPLWLQAYCFRDQSVTRSLVTRAEQSGIDAIVLTVDAPRLGRRVRDLRNGFRLPPGIGPANLPPSDFSSPQEHALAELDPHLDWSVVDWLRSVSRLPVLLKGILAPADAARAVQAGVDGIVISNHGGRQLDGVPAAFEMLTEIADAVAGRCPVLLDGGVRRGTDVLAALACGADAVLVGRPVLHGLAVAGREGAQHVLEILRDELCDAMALIGAARPADLGPGHLRRA